MLVKQMNKLADVLVEEKITKEEDRDNIVHGLISGCAMLINILTTLTIGIFLGLWIESLIFLITFSFIRTYAGGYHCKKAMNCYFVSSGMTVLVLLMMKMISQEYYLMIGGSFLCISLPILFYLVPVETKTKPLDEVEQRYFRKKAMLHLSLECVAIFLLFMFKLDAFAYVICLGITMSAILVFIESM